MVEFPGDRIEGDVLPNALQFFIVADDAIVVVALPDVTVDVALQAKFARD